VERIGWDQYFSNIATSVAARSTCPRLSVGAILVKDKHVISTGYNGAPRDGTHCIQAGCEIVDNHCVRVIHAEANAIIYASESPRYSVAYVTHSPCLECFKLLYQAGIKRIVYTEPYKLVNYQKILGISNNSMPDVVQLAQDVEPVAIDHY
jgi:dCMP deaminase